MERNIQTLAELFATFGYKTKDTPRAIWREVFDESLPDLSTKVTDDVIQKVCAFLSVEKKGRSGKIVETAKALLNGNAPAIPIRPLPPVQMDGFPVGVAISKTQIRFDPQPAAPLVGGVNIDKSWIDGKLQTKPIIQDPEKKEEDPKPSFDWKHLLFAIFCAAYAIVHAVLIWYDCIVLWPGKTTIGPGMIGGGLAFIFQMGVLVLAFDDTRGRTSSYALFVLMLVAIGAIFLHYPTFVQGSEVGQTVTMVFCGFVCLLSFSSLYLLRDSKIF